MRNETRPGPANRIPLSVDASRDLSYLVAHAAAAGLDVTPCIGHDAYGCRWCTYWRSASWLVESGDAICGRCGLPIGSLESWETDAGGNPEHSDC